MKLLVKKTLANAKSLNDTINKTSLPTTVKVTQNNNSTYTNTQANLL